MSGRIPEHLGRSFRCSNAHAGKKRPACRRLFHRRPSDAEPCRSTGRRARARRQSPKSFDRRSRGHRSGQGFPSTRGARSLWPKDRTPRGCGLPKCLTDLQHPSLEALNRDLALPGRCRGGALARSTSLHLRSNAPVSRHCRLSIRPRPAPRRGSEAGYEIPCQATASSSTLQDIHARDEFEPTGSHAPVTHSGGIAVASLSIPSVGRGGKKALARCPPAETRSIMRTGDT